ncbi:MAG: sugar ABC transporter substrate-binding protein, partial [Firmicutes bacterium]|nr:sugar ABC transporter substrate-binding protein [Bacillota bacterium]
MGRMVRPQRWFPFLLVLILLAGSVLTGCTGAKTNTAPAPAAPSSDAKPFSGHTLNVIYMAQAGYQPDVFNARLKEFEDKTGAKVNLTFVKYDEQHEKIVTSAAAPTATYDVISLDLIWTAEFGDKGYVMPLDDLISRDIKKDDIAPAIWSAFEYQGKTWAMPFLANFQLFFYNKEMLGKAGIAEPPKTLEDLEKDMETIKAKGIVKYPWSDSWNQKEGLVCEYVWMTGAYGGDTFDAGGKPIFNQGAGLQAMETMVRWLDKGLADPNSLNQDEPMAKDAFISGQAAFNSNWTFQYGLMKGSPVDGKGVMATLPVSKGVYKEGSYETASVSGFQGMAIMANTKEKDLSWELVKWMTAPDFQAQHLEEMPVWTSVQTSAETKAKDLVIDVK